MTEQRRKGSLVRSSDRDGPEEKARSQLRAREPNRCEPTASTLALLLVRYIYELSGRLVKSERRKYVSSRASKRDKLFHAEAGFYPRGVSWPRFP